MDSDMWGDAAAWAAALIGVATALIAVWQARSARSQAQAARQQADSAATQAEQAKKQADAAEAQVELMERQLSESTSERTKTSRRLQRAAIIELRDAVTTASSKARSYIDHMKKFEEDPGAEEEDTSEHHRKREEFWKKRAEFHDKEAQLLRELRDSTSLLNGYILDAVFELEDPEISTETSTLIQGMGALVRGPRFRDGCSLEENISALENIESSIVEGEERALRYYLNTLGISQVLPIDLDSDTKSSIRHALVQQLNDNRTMHGSGGAMEPNTTAYPEHQPAD